MKKRKSGIMIFFTLAWIGFATGCVKENKDEQEVLVDGVIEVQEVELSISEGNAALESDVHKEDATFQEEETEKMTIVDEESMDLLANKKTMKIYDIEDGYLEVSFNPDLVRHSYNWEQIEERDGYKYYLEETEVVSKIGVDVSTFQGVIDWQQVKKSGIEFAIIRLGFRGYGNGGLVLDKKYINNIEGALEAGLDVGVYFFSQAITVEEAVEEANYVNQNLQGYEITFPVVFDTEKIKGDTARTDNLSATELTDITIAFCERVEELGYKSMIYANSKWLTTKLELDRLEEYDIWYADYQDAPLYLYNFKMWQYTESGSVPGIAGTADINIYWK